MAETNGDTVEVLQILAETETQRYWYRICEKKWAKGTFFSLERGDLVNLMNGSGKGKSYPTKMFTLPKDETILTSIVEGIQKINNSGKTKKETK
jgi:hypothetical protein